MKKAPEHELVTRDEWDKHFWQHFYTLRRQYPTVPLETIRRRAYSATEALHGSRPPSWKWLLVKLGWGLVRSGGDMDFSWTKNLWKALRALLGVVIAAGLYAVVDVLVLQLGNAEKLAELGVPALFIPVLVAVLVSARNWLKHKKHVNVP